VISLTHLGQYWSARHREVRLLGCAELRIEGGRNQGLAYDLTDGGMQLPRFRRRFRKDYAGEDWDTIRWTYRSLPTPVLEMVEAVEAAPNRTIAGWAINFLSLAARRGKPRELATLDVAPDREVDHLVAPVLPRRAQAFGVTYQNSALERESEGACGDYGYVYRAVKERGERPEIFLKGTAPEHFVGPNGRMGLRKDRTNSIARSGQRQERVVVGAGIEPELAAVVDSRGRIWGYTLANDVSGNRIENESLLYLTQAKHFTGCLVLGPLLLLSEEAGNPALDLAARIYSEDGSKIFERSTSTSRINAPLSALIAWAGSHQVITPGEVFSTGTDMVPDGEAKVLRPGMRVEIECGSIGLLRHGAGEVVSGGSEEAEALNPDYSRWEFEGAEGR
jgi:2-keto-4-pentenoate hydratase/2-oxohepta-3-ene-1,7-dioic acid hydratase in catechol pathway